MKSFQVITISMNALVGRDGFGVVLNTYMYSWIFDPPSGTYLWCDRWDFMPEIISIMKCSKLQGQKHEGEDREETVSCSYWLHLNIHLTVVICAGPWAGKGFLSVKKKTFSLLPNGILWDTAVYHCKPTVLWLIWWDPLSQKGVANWLS